MGGDGGPGPKAARAVLVVAGSDPLGYSGLQADLRHLAALGCEAWAVPTCLTEQEPARVTAVRPVDPAHPAAVIRMASGSPRLGAVKVGLLHRRETVLAVAAALGGVACPVVLDPVIAAGSGDRLLEEDAVAVLARELLPSATVVMPNRPELERLAAALGGPEGEPPEGCVRRLRDAGAEWVYLKGGHDPSGGVLVRDHLVGPGIERTLSGPRCRGPVPRGTGCALSTALASYLARGLSVPDAAAAARERVGAAIAAAIAAGSTRLGL